MTDATLDQSPPADAVTPTPAPALIPPSAAPPVAEQALQDDVDDVDLLADDGDDDGGSGGAPPANADAEGSDPSRSPWPERPENLDVSDEEAVATWKADNGLAGRDDYQIPELDGDQHYTEYGQALAEKVTALAYDLDMSPTQAQQLILKGDGVLKALAEARDGEDKRTISKTLIEQFGGNKKAAQDHFNEMRAAVKALPDGMGELLLQARGADGRRLALRADFMNWAAQLGAKEVVHRQPAQNSRAAMQEELAELSRLMTTDIDTYNYKPWKTTGVTGSQRQLQLMRELDGQAPSRPSDRAIAEEMAALQKLKRDDVDMYRFGAWRNTGRPAAERWADLQARRA